MSQFTWETSPFILPASTEYKSSPPPWDLITQPQPVDELRSYTNGNSLNYKSWRGPINTPALLYDAPECYFWYHSGDPRVIEMWHKIMGPVLPSHTIHKDVDFAQRRNNTEDPFHICMFSTEWLCRWRRINSRWTSWTKGAHDSVWGIV